MDSKGSDQHAHPHSLIMISPCIHWLIWISLLLAFTTKTPIQLHYYKIMQMCFVFTIHVYHPVSMVSESALILSWGSRVDVLKFQTLYSFLFWPKFCFLCSRFFKYLMEWQTVQTLIRQKSSLIWVCIVCIYHFVRNFNVPYFRQLP